MLSCKNFTIEQFIKTKKLTEKHLEVFNKDNKKQVDLFLNVFKKYTKLANKLDDLEKFVKVVSTDYKIQDTGVQKLEHDTWTTEFLEFCSEGKKDNSVFAFPEVSGDKLTFNKKFNVNCIKISDAVPESIQLVNRNQHMMLAGEPKNKDVQLGMNLTFKMLIIYNPNCKKWLIVPYRIRSETGGEVNCSTIAISATNDNIGYQYKIWLNGLNKYGKDIGVLNMVYFDEKFKELPNLFRDYQTNTIMNQAKKLANTIGGKKKSKKKSKKKKKSKTKSKKKSK